MMPTLYPFIIDSFTTICRLCFVLNLVVIYILVLSLFTEINIVRNFRFVPDISEVVNAIVDGLTSTSPSDRYVVGPDAKYCLIPLSILPAFVGDFMIRVLFKLPCPQGCRN